MHPLGHSMPVPERPLRSRCSDPAGRCRGGRRPT